MKLALAPMATLSHEALRLLIHRYGDPDEYFSEMIHAPSLLAGGQFEKWYVRPAPVPEKMVWQLTGPDTEPIVKAAARLASLGGIGIDINMGCSAPDIFRSGAGIAWMSKPLPVVADLVHRVRTVIAASGSSGAACRLSVKLRLGEDENYPRLLEFCRMLVNEGVELITLHPRTRREKYARPPKYQYIARLAGDLPVPVYGNGAISSPNTAIAYMRQYSCAGLMIGRAAVQKPWLFHEIYLQKNDSQRDSEDSTPVDHLAVSFSFLDLLAECQPPEFFLSRAKRFFFYYCDNFTFAHHLKMRIQNAKAPSEIRSLLEEYFEQVPDDRYADCLSSA